MANQHAKETAENMKKEREMEGVLFKTDKEGNEKRPDFNGSIVTIKGHEFWASAWVQTSRNGVKYLRIKLNPKVENNDQDLPI